MTTTAEPDSTVQAFAGYLTEMRWKNGNMVQQLLSEMAIIRDRITSNCGELTEFKRHSSQIAQQMQGQLSDLREKLTNAFGEITTLVKQKTLSDQDMMKEINSLNQNLSYKTAEVEALKRSYAATHQQLQNQLIQIQNHLSVTGTELQNAKAHVDQVQKDSIHNFTEMEQSLKRTEDQLVVGSQENKGQMYQVSEEIQRIHETLTTVSTDFMEWKRMTNSNSHKLQQRLWALEENQKRRANRVANATNVKVSPSSMPVNPTTTTTTVLASLPTMPVTQAGAGIPPQQLPVQNISATPADNQSVASSIPARGVSGIGLQAKPWPRFTSGTFSNSGLSAAPAPSISQSGIMNPGNNISQSGIMNPGNNISQSGIMNRGNTMPMMQHPRSSIQ